MSQDTQTHPRESDADPQGQAALTLVESLLHILVEKNVLTLGDVLDALETAADVKLEIALEGRERYAIADESIRFLKAIRLSFASAAATANGGDAVKH